jgi:predicted amidohydrolase
MWSFERTKVAAVQAAPAFLDSAATTEKACRLIAAAAAQGARVIALPEVFIPGYPYWNWMMSPLDGSKWFRALYKASILVPGPETDLLARAAREAQAFVVVGVNERSPVSLGTIYNTNLILGPDGTLLGRHRKLVPTWAEKLTWASGDGSTLRTYDTPYGPLGTLACGENTNTLARFTLLSQGEVIHIANYIAFPFTASYDMPEAIRIRAGAHSFEGKVFTIVACSAMSHEIADMLCVTEEQRRLMAGRPNAFSGIFGPDGRLVAEPIIDEEGIVVAEVDAESCIEPKQFQDIVGHYNRFDVFDLRVNRRALAPARFTEAAEPDHLAQRRAQRTIEPTPELPDERIRLVGTSD